YSAWSMKASRRAAKPTLANRNTASARHSGSELERLEAAAAPVTITKLSWPTSAAWATPLDPADAKSPGRPGRPDHGAGVPAGTAHPLGGSTEFPEPGGA